MTPTRLKRLGYTEAEASKIIETDYREDDEHGQNVRDVFSCADFFVRNDGENTNALEKTVQRFIEILFGTAVHTPTMEESAMYAAHAEAAKSACLSRQVGAAIVSENGEVIGLGRNDVPKFGGGLYTENDGDCDHRCHAWLERQCHNDRKKDALYSQIFERLGHAGFLKEGASKESVAKELKRTDLKSLIEYSRAVHAEMDAITSVARMHNAGIVNGVLFSTTFPCHSCARHIVASGIKKVYFVEPYPKSLANELHSDAISENEKDKDKVLFLQYAGMAPKNFLKVFSGRLTKKGADGKVSRRDRTKASPMIVVPLDDYQTHENMVVAELAKNEKDAQQERTLFAS